MKKEYAGLHAELILFASTDSIAAAQSGCYPTVTFEDTNFNGLCDGAEDGSDNYEEEWFNPRP